MAVLGVASEALDCFEYRAFEHPDTIQGTVLVLGSKTPEWVLDMVRAAHGDMLPDDWRYRIIRDVLAAILDNPPPCLSGLAEQDELEGMGEYIDKITDCVTDRISTYTAWLTDWLASSQFRWGYAEQALQELMLHWSRFESNALHSVLASGLRNEVAEVAEVVVPILWARARAQTVDHVGDDSVADAGAGGGERAC